MTVFDFGWKCFRCLKPLLGNEGFHFSSPIWGNTQVHYCTEHAFSIYLELDEHIISDAQFSCTASNWHVE